MIVVNARFLTQQITGVQRYAIELSVRLKERMGEEVAFVTPRNIVMHDVAKQLGAVVVGSHTGYLWEQWDLPLWLKKRGSPLLLCLCNLAPVFYHNKITVIHDILFTWKHIANHNLREALYRHLFPMIMKTSRHLVTVSEFSRQDVCTKMGIDSDKFSIVPGANANYFKKRDAESRLMEEKYFFAMGRVNAKSKNLRRTLEAFDLLCKDVKDVKLYLGGYDLTPETFKAYGLDNFLLNKRVELKGKITNDELIDLYSNAIAFVYPSLGDGFGIPPLEAQSCDCPVIISNFMSLPEIYGESGLLCNPWSPDDIADNMKMVYEDQELREQLIRKGRENVKRFSFDKSADKLIEIISKYE